MRETQVSNTTPVNKYIEENFVNPENKNTNNSFEYVTSIKEEYDAVKWGAALAEASDRLHFILKGDDVEDFVHRLSTNAVNGLENYHSVNTLFTNEKGRVIDRTTLIKLENEYLLMGNRGTKEKLKQWLEKYIIMEDIKIEEADDRFFCLEVLGSRAESFVSVALETNNEDENFELNKIYNSVINGIKVYLLKHKVFEDYEKFFILGEISKAEAVVENLLSQKHIFEPRLVGDKAREIFRIEQGIPLFPNEVNDQYNPYEINLIDEVDFEKGCYIGQEVIARLDTYQKVQRFLQKVKIKSNDDLELPGDIYDFDDRKVGTLTSLTKLPDSDYQIGLGVFRKKEMDDSKDIFIHTSEQKIKLKLLD